MNSIRGAGGGKGGGGLQNDPDTLRSLSYATVDDLIGEGEIRGLVNGAQSIYLDGTPLQNPDGSYNFSNVQWDFRVGTQGQPPIAIPGANDVETEFAVSAEFSKAAPLIRSITNSNVDQVRVTVSFPSLQVTNDSGVHGTIVEYAIDVQSNGGGFVQAVYQKLNDKSSGAYQRAHRFALTGDPPWDIRLRRITDDNHSSVLQNQSYWASYTEIEAVLLNYPNSARLVVRLDASQFSSIPARAAEVYGLVLPVPVNYDPIARTYTGIWDGSFKMAWTNNPAWCFNVLQTNLRFGLGRFVDVGYIDKWALYQIAQNCDQLVPDGKGGTEPRFQCAVYMQKAESAYDALNNLASIFRGMIHYGAGMVTVTQDAPSAETPILFTNANVIDGLFSYQGGDASQRSTVALVSWTDPSNRYQPAVEYVADADGIARYGLRPVSVTAVGCITQGQAHRVGKYILYTNQHEAEIVNFSAGIEGGFARPGRIAQIADKGRAGRRVGGRLLSTSASGAVLDSAVTLTAGVGYTLFAVNGLGAVESHLVTTPAGENISELAIDAPWTSIPARMSIWLLSSDELSPQLFNIRSVSESAKAGVITYAYVGVPYNPSKFDYVDDVGTLQIPNISLLTQLPPQPQNVHMHESIYQFGATQASQVNLGCDAIPNVAGYIFQYQIGSDTPVSVQTKTNSLVVAPAPLGSYKLNVFAIAGSGRRSIAGVGSGVADGISDIPPDLDGLSATILSGGQLQLSWNAPTDPAVTTGGFIQVRYNPAMSGADWDGADSVGLTKMSGASTQAVVALMAGTYLVKPITYDGVEAANAVFLTYGAATGGTLAGSASPSAVFKGGPAADKTTAPIVFSASGGTPPYTHSIAYASGDAGISIDSPTSSAAICSSTFSEIGLAPGDSLSAIFEDTITDSLAATAVVSVNVTLARGSGGGGACVVIESFLLGGGLAGSAAAGDAIHTADEQTLLTSLSTVDAASTEIENCVRIETESGATLICSLAAPLPTLNAGLVRAGRILGHAVAVRRGESCRWEQVLQLQHVGRRKVRKISVGDRSFWAGEQPSVFILHHNTKLIR